jgi:hypothetical protein
MEEFYVLLPSNVSDGKIFADNTIANYVTKLSPGMDLKGNWQVGLVEMSYSVSWYNVAEDQNIFIVIYKDGKVYTARHEIVLRAGHYDNIEEILDNINNQVKLARAIDPDKPGNSPPSLKQTKHTKMITILNGVMDGKLVFLKFDKDLARMLGFDSEYLQQMYENLLTQHVIETDDGNHRIRNSQNRKLTIMGSRPYDLLAGFRNLYVYTDIVKPSYVGNTHVQYLRKISVPSDVRYGQHIDCLYPITYYMTLMSNEFETIEIDIKDETGRHVPFEFGTCCVKLHFRKV